MRRLALVVALIALHAASSNAWGPLGHRLVADIASARLTRAARQNVEWLLAPATLADVSSWADRYLEGNTQTSLWHYVNIPADAARYDRDRDCPRQPGVAAGAANDRWRDCAVDRILYHQERLADTALDRADRAVALKFLVHFVGDLHQPFHALATERGGNGIPVSAFGDDNCSDRGGFFRCNLHILWDSALAAHRGLDDRKYLALLEQAIRRQGWERKPVGTPIEWAAESHALARAAMVKPRTEIGETYFKAHIATVDERIALGGLRLAALVNQSLGRRGAPRDQ